MAARDHPPSSSPGTGNQMDAPPRPLGYHEPAKLATGPDTAPAARPPGTSDRNVRIEGLSATTDAAELRQMFECFGPVVSHKLMVDMRTGESRGVAFVQFGHAGDAAKAVSEMDGFSMGDRRLAVQYARISTRAPSEPTNKVVLRYIPADTGAEFIRHLINTHVPEPVTIESIENFPDTVPQLVLVMVTLKTPAEAQLCVDHVNRKQQLVPLREDSSDLNLSKRLCMPISVKLLDDTLAATLRTEKSPVAARPAPMAMPQPLPRGPRQPQPHHQQHQQHQPHQQQPPHYHHHHHHHHQQQRGRMNTESAPQQQYFAPPIYQSVHHPHHRQLQHQQQQIVFHHQFAQQPQPLLPPHQFTDFVVPSAAAPQFVDVATGRFLTAVPANTTGSPASYGAQPQYVVYQIAPGGGTTPGAPHGAPQIMTPTTGVTPSHQHHQQQQQTVFYYATTAATASPMPAPNSNRM